MVYTNNTVTMYMHTHNILHTYICTQPCVCVCIYAHTHMDNNNPITQYKTWLLEK